MLVEKTVNVFLSEFYQFPAFAVDTHVERLSKRLQLAKKDDTVVEVETKLKRVFRKKDGLGHIYNWCYLVVTIVKR